ncbi:hypothetical protein ABW20_dc0101384 [Dactylellina cionopaga]|nr:hypothetical protein ABW20_dc0101384 [Dactylellina cionopaga]
MSREQNISEYVTEVFNSTLLVSAIGMVLPSLFLTAIADEAEKNYDLFVRQNLNVSRIISIVLLSAFGCKAFHKAIEEAEDRGKYEKKHMRLSTLEAIFVTLVGLTLVTFAAYFLVGQIPHIVRKRGVSEKFMGVILVPFIEKGAENLTALSAAWNHQIDLALSRSLGGTIQTGLLVAPIVMIVAWALNIEIGLIFEWYLVFSLVVCILIVGNFLRNKKTSWLEGVFLLMVYVIIAIVTFNFPNPPHGDAAAAGAGNNTTAAASH